MIQKSRFWRNKILSNLPTKFIRYLKNFYKANLDIYKPLLLRILIYTFLNLGLACQPIFIVLRHCLFFLLRTLSLFIHIFLRKWWIFIVVLVNVWYTEHTDRIEAPAVYTVGAFLIRGEWSLMEKIYKTQTERIDLLVKRGVTYRGI